MGNKFLIDNLKEVLVGIRKRISKIENNRDDYMSSNRWVELKRKEARICEVIKREKEKQDVQSYKD